MNKKWFFLLAFVSLTSVSYAQEFKRFKVGMGLPFAPITSDQFHYYRGLYIEPAWRWNDQWATGLYLSLVGSETQYNQDHSSEDGSILTAAFTTDHYWKIGKVRHFYGLMAGVSSYMREQTKYSPYSGPPVPDEIIWTVRSGYTVAPRIGFNFWHVRTLLMYQFATHRVPDLLTIQLGFEIGGGRRKKD